MGYSLFNNIVYVYKESIKRYPKVKWFLLINFLTEILVPISAVLITTLVVYSLTNDVDVATYVLLIVGMIFTTYFLESLRYWSLLRFQFENTFTRNSTFLTRLAEHQLTTDYINVESKDRRKVITKAFEAIAGNYFGIEMLLSQTPKLVFNTVGLVVYGVLIIIYVPFVMIILLIMSIINFLLVKRANAYLAKINNELNDEFVEKYYLAKDSTNPNYGKDIRLYNIGEWFDKLFVKLTKNRRKVTGKVERKFLFGRISNTLFLLIRDFAAYSVLLGLVINGTITIATFTFLLGIVAGFSAWLTGFTSASNFLRSSNIAVNNYRECIGVKNINKDGLTVDKEQFKKPLKIQFENVSFTYPNSEKPVLENLSFTIKSGEKIALVGNNGAGKTTIIKLLCGLYVPNKGIIKVNGVDINDYRTEEYMKLISVVFQDSEPLALTIEQNITCQVQKGIDKDKLWNAIKKSDLEEKVMSLENKENTYITQMFEESGIRLSGGEIQKLMLARSLYKETPLLILDEPTAALDPISEEKMYIRYKELVEHSTSLFISHRLSSTKFCDKIFFLEDGKIIEEGTHDELIALNKKYYEVFNIQAQYYVEDAENEKY
ncbi:hypothetical protein CI105_07060 [Candidatus Izimaplasma bacterium ZiA1]|uniref:ABC transporter ATP-binding protein n=1 Tax=Candidatus Izimoplasma sp. ZiA1 TaxID=2024899 RepID=UPI000BAA92EA|nr:hypothetical protein CI105_07060 [Candidatus Izimaplasma bacterium ZiA1]